MASLFRSLPKVHRQEEPTSSDTPPKRRELSQDNPANDGAIGGAEGGAAARGRPVAQEVCPSGPPSEQKKTQKKTPFRDSNESNLLFCFVDPDGSRTLMRHSFSMRSSHQIRKHHFTNLTFSPGKCYTWA